MFSRKSTHIHPLRITVLAYRCLVTLTLAGFLIGCNNAVRWENPEPTQANSSATPAKRSKRGNPPFYEVYGVRYYVLDTSLNHSERGVASWYGKKFHGRTTSSGEIYDMYAMTAAHKTLPLPTQVRVTHVGNGKSITVTVNDRGPFVDDRIIDLSYAAARELDMIGTGTALVEIEALTVGQDTVTTAASAPKSDAEPAIAVATVTADAAPATDLFLQVGAFGDPVNARKLQSQLQTNGLSNVVIRYDLSAEPAIYRVRLGPIADATQYDELVARMSNLQIRNTHLVTESGELVDADTVSVLAKSGVMPEG